MPTAQAKPTKSFFVDMITRDISLEDSILDLIDNSIDAAWREQGGRTMELNDGVSLSNYTVEIKLNKTSFSILDNCGGMTSDDAESYAFRFGNDNMSELSAYSIGVYGIGMKRAVFKLGNTVNIVSTYKGQQDDVTSFSVPIDVRKWIQDEDQWDFIIKESEPNSEFGVEISISDLNPSVTTRFNTAVFKENLRRMIARDYTFHINRGLNINLNGERIKSWQIALGQSDMFQPARIMYSAKHNGSEVVVEIFGGMASQPPASIDPNEKDVQENTYGWYVVCNDRIVVAADKSSKTGWGINRCPRWHYQYSGFVGVVLFTSKNAIALPLTTTKRSVDESSNVFLSARTRMNRITRDWITYTNRRKQDKERIQELENQTQSTPLVEVPFNDKLRVPRVRKTEQSDETSVSYQVSRERLRDLAIAFGDRNMPNYSVGEKSFDYSYKKLVGE